MRPTTTTLLAVLLAGCLPDPSKVQVICPAESPSCPDGQVCSNGVCVAASADLAMPGSTDMTGAGADMSSGDLASVQGCKTGLVAHQVGSAQACEGAFASGGARGQCATGWSICKTTAKVDLVALNALPGFFAADAPAYWLGTQSSETCATSVVNQL